MNIKIYGTTWCPSCVSAKKFFDALNLSYEEINIEEKGMSREELAKLTGGNTVPQIIINDKCIGGFNELVALNQAGELKKIISNEN